MRELLVMECNTLHIMKPIESIYIVCNTEVHDSVYAAYLTASCLMKHSALQLRLWKF